MTISNNQSQKSSHSKIIIFESLGLSDVLNLFWQKIVRGRRVYIVEPFHAFHQRYVRIRFFPNDWPWFVKIFIKSKILLLIKATEINAPQIYLNACEQGVENVEHIAEEILQYKTSLCRLSVSTMGEETAQKILKVNLVNALAEYFSTRELIISLQEKFKDDKIVFCPSYQIGQYLEYEKLLGDTTRHLQFCVFKRLKDRLFSLCREVQNILFVVYHIGFYFLKWLGSKEFPQANTLKATIGVVLSSWDRQLENHQKSLSFLIDNILIKDDDIVFFCSFNLTPLQKKILAQRSISVVEVKQTALSVDNMAVWFRMLFCALQELFNRNDCLTKDYLLTLKSFLIWKSLAPCLKLKHFVTHADFGAGIVGRNRALKLSGIQTWYFTDSVNQLYNFSSDKQKPLRHPFYCYLDYDHLVTWTEFLAQYFLAHPGSFNTTHVVGCLWADYIVFREEMEPYITQELSDKIKNKFIVAAFDSTYSCNGLTSYAEGIAFANDIIQLADTFENVCILWREKKKRSLHLVLDKKYGSSLINLYKRIDQHPRIINASQLLSSGQMISLSDLTVSFPYTSTSFEALSAKRHALWHDAQGLYSHSFFVPPQALTHSFLQLSSLVKKLQKNPQSQIYQRDKFYQDPYQDHQAINRFRKLF